MAKRRSGAASARDSRMLAVIGAALIGVASAPTGRAAEPPIWAAEFGTFTDEFALATRVDAKGNVITCGETLGDLFALNAGRGETDAWVAKHSSTGTMMWGRQFGSAYGDVCYGASTDAAGNVYVVGTTYRWIDGERSPVAWVIKFDEAGQRLWRRSLKKPLINTVGIATDTAGNVVITGGLDFDAFAAKYDTNGRPLWRRQLGSDAYVSSNAVAIDARGNIFMAGETYGSLAGRHRGNTDAFLAKYDAGGRLQWKRQLGTRCYDRAQGITADGDGNAFVGGDTCGWFAAAPQGSDGFLAKYDPDGRQLWRRQFGTSGAEVTYGVATDGEGTTVVCGYTDGPLGDPIIGGYDGWIVKYDSDGVQVWARLIGTVEDDQVFACALNSAGHVIAAGGTDGSLAGPNAGPRDAFVAEYPGD